jgi:hypothetical protein
MLTGSKVPAVALLGAGAVLVLLLAGPTFGQTPVPVELKGQAPKVITGDSPYRLLLAPADEEEDDPPSPEVAKLRAELRKLEEELKLKLAETQRLKLRIDLLKTQEKTADQAKSGQFAGRVVLRLDDGKGASEEIILRKVDGVWKVVPSEGKPDTKRELRVIPPAGGRVVPPTPPPPTTTRPGTAPGQAERRPDADKRIDSLEKKLDKAMEILEQLRKEMDGRKRSGTEDGLKRAKELDKADAAARERALSALEEFSRGADLKNLKSVLEEAEKRAKDATKEAESKVKEALKEVEKRAKEKRDNPTPESPR